jgi:hypothetical protein
MSELPEGASYEEIVSEVFLGVSGRGLMLSALDGQLVSEWAQRGVPLDAVARGIRKAAEKAGYDRRAGEAPLRSIRACRREVEAEWKRHLRATEGSGSSGRSSSKAAGARAAGPKAALEALMERRPELTLVVTRALELGERSTEERRDDVLVLTVLRGCPHRERIAVVREAKDRASQGGVLSPRARKLARRHHLVSTARQALGLPGFW